MNKKTGKYIHNILSYRLGFGLVVAPADQRVRFALFHCWLGQLIANIPIRVE